MFRFVPICSTPATKKGGCCWIVLARIRRYLFLAYWALGQRALSVIQRGDNFLNKCINGTITSPGVDSEVFPPILSPSHNSLM